MGFAGLVPSERRSGNVQRRGSITRNRSQELRRILVEASWRYRKQAAADLIMTRRRMSQNHEVVSIAIKAQHRLHWKSRKIARKKHQCTAVTAVARELCGFIWSALKIQTQEAQVTKKREKRQAEVAILV